MNYSILLRQNSWFKAVNGQFSSEPWHYPVLATSQAVPSKIDLPHGGGSLSAAVRTRETARSARQSAPELPQTLPDCNQSVRPSVAMASTCNIALSMREVYAKSYWEGVLLNSGENVSTRMLKTRKYFHHIITNPFTSLWSIGHPRRASRHCGLQLSPWPCSMINLMCGWPCIVIQCG